jgi:hypothetical protein
MQRRCNYMLAMRRMLGGLAEVLRTDRKSPEEYDPDEFSLWWRATQKSR